MNAYLLLQEPNTVIVRMLVEVANFHPQKSYLQLLSS